MRFARTLVSALVPLILTISVFGQQTAPVAPKDPQALLIARNALAAMGASQLVSGQTVGTTGTLTLEGTAPVSFPIAIKTRGTNQLRFELTTSKGLRVTTFSGGHGAIRQPDGSVRRLTDENAISERNTLVPALSLLSEYQLPNTSLEYIGLTIIEGTPVDVIAVGIYAGSDSIHAQQPHQKTRTVFYLDHITGYVLRQQRLHYSENVQNSSQTLETRFSDWRNINGVAIPFHQQTYADGQLVLDLTLNSLTFDISVSDANFAVAQ